MNEQPQHSWNALNRRQAMFLILSGSVAAASSAAGSMSMFGCSTAQSNAGLPNPLSSRTTTPRFWIWSSTARYDNTRQSLKHWDHDNVFPLIPAMVSVPDMDGWCAPGDGPHGKGVDFERRDAWSGKSPEAAAAQTAGWVESYAKLLRSRGRQPFSYSLHLNGFGIHEQNNFATNWRNAWALGSNALDAVNLPRDNPARVGTWYSAQGRALNATWSDRFAKRLHDLLETRGMESPTAFHLDVEGLFDLNRIADWWEAALADKRASKELIDGRRTLEEIARLAPSWDPSRGTYARMNRDFVSWATGINLEIQDFVLWEGIGKAVNAQWPGVGLSNWEVASCGTGERFPLSKLDSSYGRIELRHMTHQAPVLYPIESWAYENGKVSVADHLRRFSVVPSGNADHDRVHADLSLARGRIDASVDYNLPVCPWVAHPSWSKHAPQNTAELIRYGIDNGVSDWLLWSDGKQDWSKVLTLAGC